MKNLLVLLLGLAFAAGAADARTLYVDASQPNNNGNGLKPATAKKTIQAAVNIAQAGDTILVYPGKYAPIKTNNKKIILKSVCGASKTGIIRLHDNWPLLAALGGGSSSGFSGKGKNTTMKGFLLDGRDTKSRCCDDGAFGVVGGLLVACSFQRIFCSGSLGGLAYNATLTGCMIRGNRAPNIENCILNRCKIVGNEGGWRSQILKSRLCNCLVLGNKGDGYVWKYGDKRLNTPPFFESSVLVNCTIAKNGTLHPPCKSYSSGSTVIGPLFSEKTKFYNCIFRNNYSRTTTRSNGKDVYGRAVVHNIDAAKMHANTYCRTYTDNRNPKFANYAQNDCRLTKGSPCIDQGRLNATLKRLVGSCDLSGKKRIRGKAIDMGCYEY